MIKIPLNESTFSDEEIQAAIEVVKSQRLTMGDECLKFEKQFAHYLGVKHAVMVNSGSSANLLAFFALTNPLFAEMSSCNVLCPGDEVIVTALTWSTTIWPIIQVGCIPVFVDCNVKTLQVDVSEIERAITPKTKAICLVHVLGNAAPVEEIRKIAKKNNLWLIEDACESLGVSRNGKYVGTFGDIGSFSFFFSHHITTIEGGMVVTNDDILADVFRSMRAHGWTRHMHRKSEIEAQHQDIDPRFLFVTPGFNLRPTEINAVIGRIQLRKLAAFNQRRNIIAATWSSAFNDLIASEKMKPMQIVENTNPAWFGYPVLFQTEKVKKSIKNHLEANGVETRPIICGNMARQPACKYFKYRIHNNLSNADRIMSCGLYWGLHPVMTQAQVSYLVSVIMEYFKK
ncbi:CDP-4-dehydro-6-deoxyglucose reductase, E1 [Gammaproteobacteria bacterium]